MPVHSVRKRLAPALKQQPPFDGLRHLKGQPVITAQLYFDRMVTEVDHLLFSAGTHLSVYADLPRVSPDYHNGRGSSTHSTSPWPRGRPGSGGASGQASSGRGSIVELVVAPAEDLIGQSDQQVLQQVLSDFYRMHPAARGARLTKYTLVRIPNSVYQARPGVDQYRPDQATPVPNLFLAGDYTQQEFMASIEGAVRSAKRAVERIDRSGTRD
jgi:15-cis-phytoene desaturase